MKLDLTYVRDAREALRPAIECSVARAHERDEPQWFSLRWQIPMRDVLADFFETAAADAFFWQEPTRNLAIFGMGRVAAIETHGPDRFSEAANRSRRLFGQIDVYNLAAGEVIRARTSAIDPASNAAVLDDGYGPLLVGGFAFYGSEMDPESEWAEFGPGRLVLPEVSVVCRDGQAWVTRTCSVDPTSDVDERIDELGSFPSGGEQKRVSDPKPLSSPPELGLADKVSDRGPEIRVQADRAHSQYMAQVEAALDAIEAGKFDKVVLARSLRVVADRDFDLVSFLATLRSMFPTCATLAIREGQNLFVSATPERLVLLEGDQVTTAAVAGSAPRGRSPQEEERHSARLLASEKERIEHEVVKQSIEHALRDSCGDLEGLAEPQLLKLEGIQHLETPLSGRLLPDKRGTTNVLDLVGRLHPTPAVGGAPRSPALDWLEHFEALDRGWYAGPVGYLDAQGHGEFRVALRSALLRGDKALLYAGAGIVEGSEPMAELAETRLKLRALLAPLTEI